MKRFFLFALFGIVLLIALGGIYRGLSGWVAPQSPSLARTVTYHCPAQETPAIDAFTVQYFQDGSVRLRMPEGSYRLMQANETTYENEDGSFRLRVRDGAASVWGDGSELVANCRAAGDVALAARETTPPLVNGYRISYTPPQGAQVEREREGVYKILFAGADNEPPALTAGYTITMSLSAKAPEATLADVAAQVAAQDRAGATSSSFRPARVAGRDAQVFTTTTALGNTVTEHILAVGSSTAARVTTSLVGDNLAAYRAAVAAVLDSLQFPRATSSASAPSPTSDSISLRAPTARATITSPLTIEGEAPGPWFFEGSFGVTLVDWDGKIIAETFASATREWMTEEMVPFRAELTFPNPYQPDDPDFMRNGTLILRKANPSGLPRHADAYELPVRFAATGTESVTE